MRHKHTLKVGTAVVLPLVMSACSSYTAPTASPPPPPPAASFQSQFGSGFAGFYDTGNTTEAKEPGMADVPALSPDKDPIDG